MGRRALPKLNPTLDLSLHHYELDGLPVPFDAERLFGRRAALEIEVGSGKGLFLSAVSGANAEVDFLGIEISGKYARHAAGRLAKLGRSNARVVQGDAKAFFHERLTESSVAAVHVYFPDPWWKKRHKKRRVLSDDFLRDIERVLVVGGRLHFWTDVEEYYTTTLELLASETRLAGPFPVTESPALHDLDYRTHFERRMRMHGLPVYRAEFSKSAPAVA